MLGINKIIILLAILILSILYWANTTVCKYNFAIEKRTNILNIVTEELDPTLGKAQYYQYVELNCKYNTNDCRSTDSKKVAVRI